MKIVQVCPYDFSRPGGVKSHIVSLSRQLTKLGHQVKIIAPNVNPIELDGLEVHYFGKNRSLNLGGTRIDLNVAIARELKELKGFLRQERFDLIHFHTIWNPVLPFQVLFNSKSRTVATFHDTPKSQFVGRTVMPFMAKILFPFLNEVISVSKSQSRYISRFSQKEITIIPNGIDLPKASSQSISERDNTLLFLGRLEERKGILHALEVFKKLLPKHPELHFKIAGDGDDLHAAIEYVKKNSLVNVEFLGFVSENEKWRLLQTCRVLIAPSLFGESFGIILLEAMAYGLPICGYGNEGYLNVLNEKQNPYFPPPGDVQALTIAAEQILSSESTRTELHETGMEQVRQYDWEFVSKEIEKVYLRALK